MKSKIVESGIAKRKFPLIAKSKEDGAILLFDGEGSGTVLVKGNMPLSLEFGYHSNILASCFNVSQWQILDSVTITFES